LVVEDPARNIKQFKDLWIANTLINGRPSFAAFNNILVTQNGQVLGYTG
jgi:hypothetical protein